MALTLSSIFVDGGAIPATFTCDGADTSPPLAWAELPAGTKSLALIVDDPDAPDPAAPQRTWVHWVLYNIPPAAGRLAEGGSRQLPAGTRCGKNDWGKAGYGGPCPPIGKHRYFFKLYALDAQLPDLGSTTKAELEHAMQGHVLGQAQLVGCYQRQHA
ncbi:PBP family phospholipid-binding protein [Pseudoduganella flava]|uniref:PBP family phospholipid-binding protein n=1 Tax=Pseudoduganella flava TaxID=871742 RepID=A0A562PIH9_9BURK|nr:YbhB/YbcL family Raf kinase inhibitor-like protein [Pseudoduganella flava]QGZ41868.1 YbhB/YbcL family Raf kinase inhibitor-like protein [Pseudoduganella flava]TWI44272.1 PBP family phospholipid-binding protein [Pseudoduganella flava]